MRDKLEIMAIRQSTESISTAQQQISACMVLVLLFSQLPLKVPPLNQSWGRAHVMALHPT